MTRLLLFLLTFSILVSCCNDVNCQECPKLACTKCKSGFYLTQNLKCRNCSSNCKACSQRYSCTQCIDGYYLNKSKCIQCDAGCKTCTDASVCSSCPIGQYPLNKSCFSCSVGCSNCSSKSNCTNCFSKYYYNNQQCYSCSSNCIRCQNSQNCQLCELNNFISSNGLCKFCGLSCANCTSNIGCSSCIYSNMYIENQACNYCSQGCLQCTNSQICLKCDQNASNCVQYSEKSSQYSTTLLIIVTSTAASILLIIIGVILYRRCKRVQLRRHAEPNPQRISASSSNSIIRASQSSHLVLQVLWRQIQNQIYGEQCVICFEVGDTYLSCGHIFHRNCLFEWFKHKNWCPMCHQSAISKDVTVICQHCRKVGFKKSFDQVMKYSASDITRCRTCKSIIQ